MISKNTVKLIKSLAHKKYRKRENLFLVEGDKNVLEVLNSGYRTNRLFATQTFLDRNRNLCTKAISVAEVEQTDIKKASLLQNPQNCLALCSIPEKLQISNKLERNLSVYLDDIQDPGNLGTIIRICDWFNIENLFISPNSADIFNPKVIQSSMGSFCRVRIIETTFNTIVQLAHKTEAPIFGAFLDGKNIYTEELPQKAILVMGNEGKGIQKEVEKSVDRRIKIPEFSTGKSAESLNVSVATAIICSEFKRKSFL